MKNNTPLSRVEDILQSTIDNTEYDKPPQSRVESLLIELKEVIGGGGSSAYHPAGSVDYISELPSPSADYLGYVYDITQAFTTTSDFKEGAGKRYPAGSNIAIVDVGTPENPSYKYDVLSGFIDTSNFVEKEEGKGLSTNDYTNADKTKLGGIAEGAEVNVQSDWNESDNSSDAYIQNKPTLGTASALNVAESGNAGNNEVVKGNDSRLTDDRNPTPHTHTVNQITDFPTLGTAAGLNVPVTGDANSSEVVKGDDSRIVNSPITSTTTGINPTITDSADGLIQNLTVYGESRTSKNLLDVQTVTVGNITFTVDSDKYITASPNDSDSRIWGYANSQYFLTLPAGTYNIVFIAKTQTSNINSWLRVQNAESQELVGVDIINKSLAVGTFTLSATTDIGVMCKLWDAVARFMICTAADYAADPTFEPYFSGIHGIGEDGKIDVVTRGKNLIDANDVTLSAPWYVIQPLTPLWLPAGQMTLSFDFSGETATAQFQLSKSTNSFSSSTADVVFTVISGHNIINVNNIQDSNEVTFFSNAIGTYSNIQLELGSTATAYEPYVFTSATVTTGIPLYAVGDVKDELIAPKMVMKRTEKIVITDSSDVELASAPTDISGGNRFLLDLTKNAVTVEITEIGSFICDNLEEISQGNVYGGNYTNCISCSGNTIYFRVSGISTVEALKAYLTSNPVTVVYELAEPYEIPLTASELSALRNLRTYNPTTNVMVTDDPTSTVGYLLNTDNGQAVADVQNGLQEQIDDVEAGLQGQIDEIKIEKNHFCYSYKIDMSDSNPATCVKPHFDPRYGCDNFNFTSAHMDYANDKFDYGSWEGFIRRIARPCMLKYDGTVDYYLDPDDYSKKITGEASDVADVNYQGNAMVELEKLYFKRYTYNGIQYCFIADRKLDKSFKCYAHHDKYGRELDYIYRACYDGMYDGTRLRSISGVDYHNLDAFTAGYIMSNTTRQEEMNFAKANNVSTEKGEGWNILHKSEWDYINDILVLIGMSTDTQTTFGRGKDSGYVSATDTGIIGTGTMDTKGLFWGENNGSAGVKVLGIENPWANIWKSYAGWMLISNQHYTKMTFGTEDGSTGTGFNTDGTGYLATGASISANGYISDWAENDNGFLPTAASGSASTYRCDYVWQDNATCFAFVGGASIDGLQCGAFFANLGNGAGTRYWSFGAALSYKGLAAA